MMVLLVMKDGCPIIFPFSQPVPPLTFIETPTFSLAFVYVESGVRSKFGAQTIDKFFAVIPVSFTFSDRRFRCNIKWRRVLRNEEIMTIITKEHKVNEVLILMDVK